MNTGPIFVPSLALPLSALRDSLVGLFLQPQLVLVPLRDALVRVFLCQAVLAEVHGAKQMRAEVLQVLLLDDLRGGAGHEALLPAVEQRLPLHQDTLAVVLALGEQRLDEGLAVVGVVLRGEVVQPPGFNEWEQVAGARARGQRKKGEKGLGNRSCGSDSWSART